MPGCESPATPKREVRMAVFVLVHGAFHGAWCWDHLTPHLAALGHECIAVDLPCEDPEAGAVAYALHVSMALGNTNGAILVGHSLGGLTIPLVATDRRVRRLVYLCAAVPIPGASWLDQETTNPVLVREAPFETEIHDDGTSSVTDQGAIDAFYHDCTPQTQTWALAHLRRQAWLPSIEPAPLAQLPDVPSSVILGRDDRVVPTAYIRESAGNLGVVPIELDGGHMPILARPEQLAHELDKLASL
jgi:pimeloyl-ACP methyl ester carboxylesterase